MYDPASARRRTSPNLWCASCRVLGQAPVARIHPRGGGGRGRRSGNSGEEKRREFQGESGCRDRASRGGDGEGRGGGVGQQVAGRVSATWPGATNRCTGARPGEGRHRPALAVRGGRGVEEDEAGRRRTENQPPPRSPRPIASVAWEETEGAKRLERMGREVS